MNEFIYVFNDSDRDELLNLGYTLLKSDDNNKVFVFKNNATMNFSLSKDSVIFSNTLTF